MTNSKPYKKLYIKQLYNTIFSLRETGRNSTRNNPILYEFRAVSRRENKRSSISLNKIEKLMIRKEHPSVK